MPVPLGAQGYQARQTAWWAPAEEEETPELRWPLSNEVYDRMRRQDAQVMSVLRAVTLPIRRTTWRLDAAGCRPEVTQLVAEDLGLPVLGQDPGALGRTKGRFSWPEHLRLALTCLPFGHSFFEQEAQIIAGRARLKKLAWRPPRTINRIEVAPDGGLVAIYQPGVTTADAKIPVDRLVAYVHDREGGNWLGQSLLRPAFKFWLLKDRALRTTAQTIERNGLGVPIYTAGDQPDSVTGQERVNRQTEEMEAGSELAQAYRAGENAGAAIPFGAKLELKGVTGTLPNADPFIRYADEQIARAVLANFLSLGGDNATGSYALGETLGDFFVESLQTIALSIADTATQHVVEDLVDWNWGPEEPAPRVVFDEIGSRHAATAEALMALVQCGALTPDEPLERFIRTTYGLPEADPETRREKPAPTPPANPAADPEDEPEADPDEQETPDAA